MDNAMLPYVPNHKGWMWGFQHDCDSKYITRQVRAYIEDNEIEVLLWLAQLSSIKPIKNLWQRVETIWYNKLTNMNDLCNDIIECSVKIPLEVISKLHQNPVDVILYFQKIVGSPIYYCPFIYTFLLFVCLFVHTIY